VRLPRAWNRSERTRENCSAVHTVRNPLVFFVQPNDNQNLEWNVIAQAVSRWLPTAATWVRARVKSCGIYGGQSRNGAWFLRVFRSSLSLIPPTAPRSSSIILGWHNMANSSRRNKWTHSHPTPRTRPFKTSSPVRYTLEFGRNNMTKTKAINLKVIFQKLKDT
jgi:hypothetical protein